MVEGLHNLLLHLSAELAEAQRTLGAHEQVITACRENMKLLEHTLEAKDEVIAK
jgi:hypothetical protein